MTDPDTCVIGNLSTDRTCHRTWYRKDKGFKLFNDLTSQDKLLLIWRTGLKTEFQHGCLEISDSSKVCFHHYCKYLTCFESKQKSCNNPFGLHNSTKKRKQRQGQYSITVALAQQLETFFELIPGQKLCKQCWDYTKTYANDETSDKHEYPSESSSNEAEQIAASSLDDSLAACGVSPFKTKGKSNRQKIFQAHKKIQKVTKNLETVFSLKGIDLPEAACTSEVGSTSTSAKTEDDLIILMHQLKEKFTQSNSYDDQIQILTLKPNSWSIEETMEFFEATSYQVRKALSLKKEKGILAKPKRNERQGINQDTINIVKSFFESDEYSREMPGAKEYVSIGYKIHKQKRLLLSNLSELYSAFKEKYPDLKIGFSKFCSLRPKWCKIIGSSGSHSVCVCTIHQNTVLACHALNLNYKVLISKVVCNPESKICMIHRCPKCPGKDDLLQYLQRLQLSGDQISFQQWVFTDRTTMISMIMEPFEFCEFVADKIDHLTSHSYIAKCQAKYLTHLKDNISKTPNTCIVLADFAENYSMVIQDAVQGWHWTKQQCTIHPIVMYYSDEQGNSQVKSFAFFSDDLEHDTGFVYQLQKLLCEYLHENFGFLTQIEYFSDGCASQYKNYKNFFNLTFHQQDFGINATWNFFATSHGKSPCDGLGGTIKRKLANESLCRTIENPIITAIQAFEYCKRAMPSIEFFFIEKEHLHPIRTKLQNRYAGASTLPGTRSYHVFIPNEVGIISYKRTAEDQVLSGTHNFLKKSLANYIIPKIQDYVAVVYDNHWWIGLVEALEEETLEAKVKFMTPHGPRKSFYWPARDDTCFVPFSSILRIVNTLAPTSQSGRTYQLTDSDFKAINKHNV